jgi:Stage II sporulation protein E (SpoIIE)
VKGIGGEVAGKKRRRWPRWLRGYLDGLTAHDLQRLFRRDAREAYAVLARGHDTAEEPTRRTRRLFHRAKIVFLGLSYKLTPARRLLFAAGMACAFIGLFRFNAVVGSQHITVDFSPLWFLLSVGCLTFLLALELVDRVRVRDELEVARALQRDLLPRAVVAPQGYRVAHSYHTANEVGGDYYDFLPLADGRLALVIGDASGHGMAAGLLMAIANATLKLAMDLDPAPQRVATLLNRVLWRTGDRRSFMSLFYALLEPMSGRLDFICAGHPFPMLRRRDGRIIELGSGSFPLGVRESLELAPETAEIDPGDLLFLYTDGLPEAADASGEAFGYERIRDLLAPGGSPSAVHDRALDTFTRFHGDEPLADDACVVVLARDPE